MIISECDIKNFKGKRKKWEILQNIWKYKTCNIEEALEGVTVMRWEMYANFAI